MKSSNEKRQRGPSSNARAANRPSPKRRRLFRLLALALPLLMILGLELALRIFGYGYPSGFFIPGENGTVRENDRFTRRFFPPGLQRVPQSILLPVPKPADVYRIFVFGESAAMGDPEPAYGFCRQLEVLLNERFEGRTFEVVNVAVTAINSHVILPIARACAVRQGDLWLVYMGNNEVVGPYGAGTVFGDQVPSLGVIRAGIALKATRVGQWLDSLVRPRSARPAEWGGMEMFLDQQVRLEDPRMEAVYEHFRRNLEDVLRCGLDRGVDVVVATVASNLKDCPPFGSLHTADVPEETLQEWTRRVESGNARETAGDRSGAIEDLEQSMALDEGFAEVHFRLGGWYLAGNDRDRARRHLVAARDLDTLRFRADSRLNAIVAEVAGEMKGAGVGMLDVDSICSASSPDGIAGAELFYEHVHFNVHGNYVVARAFLDAVASRLPGEIHDSGKILSEAECAARLAWTEWDRMRVLEEMVRRLEQPPFTGQLGHERRQSSLESLLGEKRRAYDGAAFARDKAAYDRAISRRSEDWTLRENAARFLEENGEAAQAEVHRRKVVELIPHYGAGQYSLGNNLDQQGRSEEALPHFMEALRLRPDSAEARTGLGLALSNLGRTEEAMGQYERVLEAKPDFVGARVNLGQLFAARGETNRAMAEYRAALKAQTNHAGAHINLGKLLSDAGDLVGAAVHYREAVRAQPGNALAHYNLGNALAARGDPEALRHYAEAVRLRPSLAEARYNLAIEFMSRGRNQEAQRELEAVLSLNPDSVPARLNLGVALAKQGEFASAAEAFREALRRDPGNPDAARFLQQAEARMR